MRFKKEPLNFTVHKDMPWNNIKKQYLKHLVEFMNGGEPIKKKTAYVYGEMIYPLYRYLANESCVKRTESREHVPDIIWAFDVIETLIDPTDLLNDFTAICDKNTRIFITCPHRSFVPAWSYNHWHEIDPERFRYLADSFGFKIVKEKHVTIKKPRYFYLTGLRPFLRLFVGRSRLGIYELRLK